MKFVIRIRSASASWEPRPRGRKLSGSLASPASSVLEDAQAEAELLFGGVVGSGDANPFSYFAALVGDAEQSGRAPVVAVYLVDVESIHRAREIGEALARDAELEIERFVDVVTRVPVCTG